MLKMERKWQIGEDRCSRGILSVFCRHLLQLAKSREKTISFFVWHWRAQHNGTLSHKVWFWWVHWHLLVASTCTKQNGMNLSALSGTDSTVEFHQWPPGFLSMTKGPCCELQPKWRNGKFIKPENSILTQWSCNSSYRGNKSHNQH